MRRVLMLPAVVAALAVAAPPAAPLALPEGLSVGVQDDRLPVADPAALDERVADIAATGVRVTRVDVLWNEVAPERPADARDPADPAYRWERYDRIVDGLAARGVDVLLTVYRTPSWAVDPRYAPRDPPQPERWAPAPDALGDFAFALARRYDGTAHARVSAFEPWNEPNIPFFLRPQWLPYATAASGWRPGSPEIYSAMLTAAYDGIRAAQPDATVAGVSGAPNGGGAPPTGPLGFGSVPNSLFMAELARLQPPMDVASQHLYPALGPQESTAFPSFRTLPRLLSELDAIRPGIPLWVTEFGYMTRPPASRPTRPVVTEEQQAAYAEQAVAAMAAVPRVDLAVWFNLQDNAEWPGGLRREDGSPKPVWDVFLRIPKLIPDPVPVPPSAPEPPA